MSKADVATRLYAFSVLLSEIATRKREAAANKHMATSVDALYVDLHTRLEVTFDFTKQQNVRLHILFFVHTFVAMLTRTLTLTLG